jgi:spore maturation protein CgeB
MRGGGMTLNIVVFGLSITSSWGNGHATTYRALLKALAQRGHRVTFLERDVPWYRAHRDLANPSYCKVELYPELQGVSRRFAKSVFNADLVILGSYVPDGAILADWITTNAKGVTAFYDIDTPVTLAGLDGGKTDYITAALIPRFDLYLSFTGGPVLEVIERIYGSPRARPLYCSVDPDLHKPAATGTKWHLGYLGTYSEDRDQKLNDLLIAPAEQLPQERFVVAGANYPNGVVWPPNVERVEHVSPEAHSSFYCGQRYTLNITRANMVEAGFSPSVRLFEAAAAGVPIISDRWPGIESIFKVGGEILIADMPEHVVNILSELPEDRRRAIAAAARKRVLADHTAEQRARQLEQYYEEVIARNLVQVRDRASCDALRVDAAV